MANEKEIKKEGEGKSTIVDDFRKKLRNREELKATVAEGLKSANSRIRSLAVKAAFKLGDHSFIKQNVLNLINSEKSKKVLRALSDRITRRELYKKVRASKVVKVFGKKKPTGGDAAVAPSETKTP